MRIAMLLLAAGCAAVPRVRVEDVDRAFVRDTERARFAPPAKGEAVPVRGAYAETRRLAERHLARREDRYVRALLACAHLAAGDLDAAHAAVRAYTPRRGDVLSHENRIARAADHAVSGCRAVAARAALRAMFDGELAPEAFLAAWSSYVGVVLPDPEHEPDAYRRELEEAARHLRATCFSRIAGDPRGMERVDRHRTEHRQRLGEHVYNEAARLATSLPDPDASPSTAPLRFLAAVSSGLFIVAADSLGDVLPEKLGEEQQIWMKEQTLSAFDRAFLVAGHYRAGGADLYRRLEEARSVAVAWIETR